MRSIRRSAQNRLPARTADTTRIAGRDEMVRLGFPRQPGMTLALSPAVLTASDFAGLRFVHHWTGVARESAGQRPSGATVWIAAARAGQCVAISFDWQVIEFGVVCIRDPLQISSNAWLIGEDGTPLEPHQRLRCLLESASELDWQATIVERLPVQRAPAMN